jgi:hypothetical protein
VSVGTHARTCAHWHVVAGRRRIRWGIFYWQSLFVKGSKREAPYFHTNITVAMRRCHHLAHCYVKSLPSGPDHNSNGHGWLHRAHCYVCPLARWCRRNEDPVEKIPLTIFFCYFHCSRIFLFINYLYMVLKPKNIYTSLWIVTTHYKLSTKLFYHSKYYVIFYILIWIVKIHCKLINMEEDIVTIDCFHNIQKIVISWHNIHVTLK